jgi:hypothetical protein
MLPIAHERENHAHGESIRQRQPGCEIHREDHLEPEDQIVHRGKCDLGAAETDIGVRNIRVAVQPLAFALAFAVEELEALNCSHRLDKR